jgi:hypothetical protein
MEPFLVKNKRLKMSPGGIITLPVAARKTLQMEVGKGGHVTIAIDQRGVRLRPAGSDSGSRVSPKGQMELQGDAKALLANGEMRHFWLELYDNDRVVILHPY